MTTPQSETILDLAGEGGGYTIESMQSPEGRRYRLISSGMGWDTDADEEVWFTRHGEWRTSMNDVFAELNPRWYLLHPSAAHPDFAPAIWENYLAACRTFKDQQPRSLGQWSEVLLGNTPNALEAAQALFDAVPHPGPEVKKAHWQPFATRLQSVLAGMQEDQFLVLTFKETNRFVQFAAQGALGMRVEATSNHFLSGRDKLGDKQIRALVKLGWCKPTGTPGEATPEKDPDGSSNFFVDVRNPVDFSGLATLAVNTLSEVFGVPHEGFLQYEAFDYAGNQFAWPALQIKRGVRDPKLKMADLAERLLDALREATQLHDLDFNDEGDVLIQAEGVSTYVIRLVGRPPMVQFFTPLLHDVSGTKKWLDAVNYLNTNAGPVRYAVQENSLIAMLDIPAWPLQTEHVATSLERFDAAIRGSVAWLESLQ